MEQNINQIVIGMTPQEKEKYFSHLERNTRFELDKVEIEKEQRKNYKASLIEDIIKWANGKWTEDQLKAKDIRTLERIYDYC